MDALIESLIRDGVKFVGVVGDDCEKIEDIIDEMVVGEGNNNNSILPLATQENLLKRLLSLRVPCLVSMRARLIVEF